MSLTRDDLPSAAPVGTQIGGWYMSPTGWESHCSPPFCITHRGDGSVSPLEQALSERDLAALAYASLMTCSCGARLAVDYGPRGAAYRCTSCGYSGLAA